MDGSPGTTIIDYLRSAFAHLFEMEQNMLQMAAKMAEADENLKRLLVQYGDLQHKLEHSDFYQIDAKVEEVAAGLGLLRLGMDHCVEKLSGNIEWLIGYLKNYEQAFLVVSHDERFLNEIATVIYHLEHQTVSGEL